MKSVSLPGIKTTRLYLLSFLSLASLMLSLTFIRQIGHAAPPQLSLADILIGLRSKKAEMPEKNKLLTEAVKERGVTFVLTSEIEKELESTGADKELIDAIRQKSQIIKVAATPAPKPSATPNTVAVSTPQPTPIPTPTPPDFTFYQRRADENISKGEFDLAVNDYSKVIELNPKATSAYLNRGLAFYNKKSYTQAVADYDKVIELNPKESMVYFNRGDSYEKMGDVQKAIADYQKAVDLDANNQAAKNSLKRLQDEQANAAKQKEPEKTPPIAESAKVPPAVNLGQLTSELAVRMVKPIYSTIAQKATIEGKVIVEVTLDEKGDVTSAKATSGPGLLRSSAEDAARKSKFKPAMINNQEVKSTGFIVYNFSLK